MEIPQLNAYCVFNYSDKPITIEIYKAAENPVIDKSMLSRQATYNLQPGDRRCRDWKNIDKNNRKKQWGWKAYTRSGSKLGEGFFPIGGVIEFSEYDKFEIKYLGKPWEYKKSPWNWPDTEIPWKTYKH